MAKGKRGPRPQIQEPVEEPKTKTNGHSTPLETIYQCKQCPMHTLNYEEIVEHLAGTGHADYDTVKPAEHKTEEQQAALFSEPQTVTRSLPVRIGAEEMADLNAHAGVLAVKLVEQEEMLALTKDRIKGLTVDRNAMVAKLRYPFKHAAVTCEWRINFEENSKSLYRLDTDELVETKPLSEEDRAAELARIEKSNAQQEAVA